MTVHDTIFLIFALTSPTLAVRSPKLSCTTRSMLMRPRLVFFVRG